MPHKGGNYSAETPYGCRAGKHFASSPITEPCEDCEREGAPFFCSGGRHVYMRRSQAAASNCCQHLAVIDTRPFLAELPKNEELLSSLSERISQAVSNLQRLRGKKSELERGLESEKNRRSEALATGEYLHSCPDVVLVPEDIKILDQHISREQDALAALRKEEADVKGRIRYLKGKIAEADRQRRRNAIYERMSELVTEWNRNVREILRLRQEAGIDVLKDLAPIDWNGGPYPLLPPGFPERYTDAGLKAMFFMKPHLNRSPREILEWRAPDEV